MDKEFHKLVFVLVISHCRFLMRSLPGIVCLLRDEAPSVTRVYYPMFEVHVSPQQGRRYIVPRPEEAEEERPGFSRLLMRLIAVEFLCFPRIIDTRPTTCDTAAAAGTAPYTYHCKYVVRRRRPGSFSIVGR